MENIHISISAEPIFHLGRLEITNSMTTGIVVSAVLVGASLLLSRKLTVKKVSGAAQNLVEMALEGLYNLMITIAGERKTREFFPLIATFFLYILVSNWFGLL